MEKGGHVYILGSISMKLYVGVTSDLVGRTWEHKVANIPGFTQKYHIHQLLYYEWFDDIESAIRREKELKHWKRTWKLQLIKKFNSDCKDLYCEIINDDYRSSIIWAEPDGQG